MCENSRKILQNSLICWPRSLALPISDMKSSATEEVTCYKPCPFSALAWQRNHIKLSNNFPINLTATLRISSNIGEKFTLLSLLPTLNNSKLSGLSSSLSILSLQTSEWSCITQRLARTKSWYQKHMNKGWDRKVGMVDPVCVSAPAILGFIIHSVLDLIKWVQSNHRACMGLFEESPANHWCSVGGGLVWLVGW